VVGFNETSYGIVKRLHVVQEWTRLLAATLGRDTLTILDIGCGTGDHLTYPLALDNHRVVGIDLHEQSIQEARRRYRLPNLTFRVAQIDLLLKESLVFDLIICSEVLEHVYHPQDFMNTVRQLVRTDGGVIVTTPNGYGSYEMLCRIHRGLEAIGVNQILRGLTGALRRSPDVQSSYQGQLQESIATESNGFLNRESGHVQFFQARTLYNIFGKSGFLLKEQRARTLLCGPYVDVLLRLPPCRQALYSINNRLADLLPFSCAADWMFLLQPRPTSGM
jgi:SAM-dependent methyltransferase